MYDFKQLSPADFEELTCDLLQRHWGLQLESFKNGKDSGIDLRYAEVPGHSIIVQCKHFAGSSIARLVHELRSTEAPKVTRLAPDRYVLVTSLPLSPNDKSKIQSALRPHIKTTQDIIGAGELNSFLGTYSEIEIKNFKLWLSSVVVLQRILHNAEKVQTNFDVDRVRRSIPFYVHNENFARAFKTLSEGKFIIISGVPGIGKTTLADMLLLTYLGRSFEPVVIKSEIIEGRRLFNNEAKQIFYFDDFLGETFLGNRVDFVGKKEDSAILDFMEIIARSKHARLILTTREHILQHAFQISERFQRGKGALSSHQCILELKNYSLLDRARILYNHIYFSDLPIEYKLELLKDQFYMAILKHRNFNPRLVEWLSKFTNVKALPTSNYRAEVERVLENPAQLWQMAFERQISEASRSVILALYSLGGNTPISRLEIAWKSLHQKRASKYNFRTAAEDWRRSLQDLEGGFLTLSKIRNFDRVQEVAFVNPSVRDFLDATLTSDSEHLDDLLSATCLFVQILNVWSLVMSEKGTSLQERFAQNPDELLEVISHMLPRPDRVSILHGSNVGGTRIRDTFPEVRLKTLISIANHTRAPRALDMVITYSQAVIDFWSGGWVAFAEAASVLSSLDASSWPLLSNRELHMRLKTAMLSELADGAGSDDIAPVVKYASSNNARWSPADETIVRGAFSTYLNDKFDEELSDCSSEGDLASLSTTLEEISAWFGEDVHSYQREITKRIEDYTDSDDDDERPSQSWGAASVGPMAERKEDAEVTRLFDGLET